MQYIEENQISQTKALYGTHYGVQAVWRIVTLLIALCTARFKYTARSVFECVGLPAVQG
jgi:hypothetical protein